MTKQTIQKCEKTVCECVGSTRLTKLEDDTGEHDVSALLSMESVSSPRGEESN